MKLVIVESPAKAQTINKYLGNDYKVIASVGHIRDLPSKDGAVKPDENFKMSWEMNKDKDKVVKEIIGALKSADSLILATDPDREGEAISWHLKEILDHKKTTTGKPVERVVFNEITKSAVLEAMKKPRGINSELVEAYLARRALDHLIGFSISPILWRKLPGSRSAGRVQSVALKLICEREIEIEKFNIEEYWSISSTFSTVKDEKFSSRLTVLNSQKLAKMDIKNEKEADLALQDVKKSKFNISKIELKRVKRNPLPPFTTSTLQQEASNKLGFSASRTMRVAQKLYEGINIGSETSGLITYMRTDGVQLSSQAIEELRNEITSRHGENYIPPKPRVYKSKAANAQEAHEAIRPTLISRDPESISEFLDSDQNKLYELIWKRTISSQMQSAELDETAADITNQDQSIIFRANGSQVIFPGFYIYRDREDDRLLPKLIENEKVDLIDVKSEQHFTQPPPRYTDASLIKKMEELGIGRPSTYASILQVLVNRNYVEKEKGRHIPQERGRILTAFLNNFFGKYIEYDFTADLEKQLDKVSDGKLNYKNLLKEFWDSFKPHLNKMTELERDKILEALEKELAELFFPSDDIKNGTPNRKCPTCSNGNLGLELGKYGAFIGCSNYPECKFTKQIASNQDQNENNDNENFIPGNDGVLGIDPATGLNVFIKKGPYGIYLQLGDEKKPKRTSIPKQVSAKDINLEKALAFLSLPRLIGQHPESGQDISAGIGRYGPYLKYDINFISLPADETVINLGLNHAVVLIAENSEKLGKVLGDHPDGGGKIFVKSGRFGPYVEHNKLRATLPKDISIEEINLDKAIELLIAKAARPKRSSKKTNKSKKTK
jgi:DNA topoisomerase-1